MTKASSNIKSVLVVKYRALGDSIMGLSTLNYVKKIFPTAKIYYGLPVWTTPLYSQVELAGVEILPISLDNIAGWWKLFRFLRKNKIELIYEMHLAGRTKSFFSLYSLIFRTPYFYHNHHLKVGESDVIDQGIIKPLIQRDLDGAYTYLGPYNFLVSRPEYLKYRPSLKVSYQGKDDSIIFGVVATRETKRYPLHYFKELANLISKKYPRTKIKIPLSKSIDDQKIYQKILDLKFPENTEIVFWSLKELPLKMVKSSLYIGNDTGLKHLAAALSIKTYTFFGPEPTNEWHPYDKNEHPFFYLDNLECRTRTHHYCGLSTCDSMICLNGFTPEKVFDAIDFGVLFK